MIEFSLAQIARHTCAELLLAYGLLCCFLYVSLTFAARTRKVRAPRRQQNDRPYTVRMAQARAAAQSRAIQTASSPSL